MANKQIEKSTFSFDVEVRMLEIFDWPKRQINSMNIFFQSHTHTRTFRDVGNLLYAINSIKIQH